jgi:hypothetical protein
MTPLARYLLHSQLLCSVPGGFESCSTFALETRGERTKKGPGTVVTNVKSFAYVRLLLLEKRSLLKQDATEHTN